MSQSFKTGFVAQSSQAGTADTRVTAGQTTIDIKSASANAEGAHDLLFELDMTVAPSTATYVKCYMEYSQDNSKWSAPKYVGVFSDVGTAAEEYQLMVAALAPYQRVSWEPVGYGLTAVINCTPSIAG